MLFPDLKKLKQNLAEGLSLSVQHQPLYHPNLKMKICLEVHPSSGNPGDVSDTIHA